MLDVAPTTSDKGGTFVNYDGHIRLLEMAQVPRDHEEEFESARNFKLFSMNNLWIILRCTPLDMFWMMASAYSAFSPEAHHGRWRHGPRSHRAREDDPCNISPAAVAVVTKFEAADPEGSMIEGPRNAQFQRRKTPQRNHVWTICES